MWPDILVHENDLKWGPLFEDDLREIAAQFAAMGFDPPDMATTSDRLGGQIVEADETEKYAVYLYNFLDFGLRNKAWQAEYRKFNPLEAIFSTVVWQDALDAIGFKPEIIGSAAGYAFGCHGGRNFFGIDKSNLEDRRVGLNPWLYRILAHELLHIIQYTYDKKYRSIKMCEAGRSDNMYNVVVEGMAEAATNYVTAIKYPGWLAVTDDRSALGAYSYLTNFAEITSRAYAYDTSSFWRHFADRWGGLEFFEFLLRQTYQATPNDTWHERMKWLDRALKVYARDTAKDSLYQHGLYLAFPHFMTELLSYGNTRYLGLIEDLDEEDEPEEEDPEANQAKWRQRVIWNCTEGGQKKRDNSLMGDPPAERTLWAKMTKEPLDGYGDEAIIEVGLLLPLASHCAKIEWEGYDPPDRMVIEVIGTNKKHIDQLHLGVADRGMPDADCYRHVQGKPDTAR